MFILALQNSPYGLEYRVWNMDDISSRLLIKGKITGIGEDIGEHTYSYGSGFGSGRGKSRTPGYEEAIAKISDIIQIASQGFFRLEELEIDISAVGYVMTSKPQQISGNTLIDESFVENLLKISTTEPPDVDLVSDARLLKSSMVHFHSAFHAVLFDELTFNPGTPENRHYPIPNILTLDGKINKFSHGALRLKSIMENASRAYPNLPRRIIVCDLDEITQVTAVKGEKVVASTHEYGGSSSIFSTGNCGAINPLAIKFLSEKAGVPCSEIIDYLSSRSGARNPKEGIESMRQLADHIRLDNINPYAQMYVNSILYAIAGMVALLGGIELLIITGDIGADFPALRAMLVKKLHILRLSLDETRNDSEIKLAEEITGRDCKVKIVVSRPNTDKQIAKEIMKLLNPDRESAEMEIDAG